MSGFSVVLIVGLIIIGALFVVALAGGLAVFVSLTRRHRHTQPDQLADPGLAANASANPYDPGQVRSGPGTNWLPAVIAAVSVAVGLLVLLAIVFVLFIFGLKSVRVGAPGAPPTPVPPPIVVERETLPVVPPSNQ